MTLHEVIAAGRSALSVEVDGKNGMETSSAIYQEIVLKKVGSKAVAAELSAVDPRSENAVSVSTLRLDGCMAPRRA